MTDSAMNGRPLQLAIERFFLDPSTATDPLTRSEALAAFLELRQALEAGVVRSAEPDAASPTGWRVNAWVKQGILLGFRLGTLAELPGETLSLVDKDTFPLRRFRAEDGVRIVAGGSSVRAGAYVARSVICVPPMYINTGAYVD